MPRPRGHCFILYCPRAPFPSLYNYDSLGKTTSAGSGNHFTISNTRRLSSSSPCRLRAKTYPCFITTASGEFLWSRPKTVRPYNKTARGFLSKSLHSCAHYRQIETQLHNKEVKSVTSFAGYAQLPHCMQYPWHPSTILMSMFSTTFGNVLGNLHLKKMADPPFEEALCCGCLSPFIVFKRSSRETIDMCVCEATPSWLEQFTRVGAVLEADPLFSRFSRNLTPNLHPLSLSPSLHLLTNSWRLPPLVCCCTLPRGTRC